MLAGADCASEENFAPFDADEPDSYAAVRYVKKNLTR